MAHVRWRSCGRKEITLETVVSPAAIRELLHIPEPLSQVEMSWDCEAGLYVKVIRTEPMQDDELPQRITLT